LALDSIFTLELVNPGSLESLGKWNPGLSCITLHIVHTLSGLTN